VVCRGTQTDADLGPARGAYPGNSPVPEHGHGASTGPPAAPVPLTLTLPGLLDGAYRARLHFYEGAHTAINQCVFSVAVNGTTVLSDLDLWHAAGYQSAWQVDVPVTVSGNQVVLALTPSVGQPVLSAVELIRVYSNPLALDPLVESHLQRVSEAGGQHVDQAFLVDLVALLRQLGVADKILHLSDVRLGCVVAANGEVSRLFCLGGHDAVSRGGVALPQRVAAGLNGRPAYRFQQAGLFMEDFNLATSDRYTVVALVRQGADSQGAILGCRPLENEEVRLYPVHGYLRFRHTIGWTGQELTFDDGTSYNSGWVCLGARYDLARTAMQLVGSAYSFRTRQVNTMGYAYNNARTRRMLASPLCLGSTGGPSPVFTMDGSLVSICWLKDYDDEAGLASLRSFLLKGYV